MRSISSVGLAAMAVFAFTVAGAASPEAKPKKDKAGPPATPIGRWLALGPAVHPETVFQADGDEDEKPKTEELLGPNPFDGDWPRPREGREVAWFDGRSLRWTAVNAPGKEATVTFKAPEKGRPALALLATYINVDRWAEVELVVESPARPCAWLDGQRVFDCEEDKPEGHRGDLELTPGTHLLVVQSVLDPELDAAWKVRASLAPKDGSREVRVATTIDAQRTLDILDVLDAPKIDSAALSPDGERIATIHTRYAKGSKDAEKWVEVRDTTHGLLLEARREPSAQSIAWSPDGRYLSWVGAAGEKASALYLSERATGRTFPLLDGIEKLGSYRWSPDGRLIVYATTEEAKKDERGVKRVMGLMDRWASFRDKQHLHLVTVPDAMTRRLTAGEATATALDFSPDARRLLFSRQFDDYADRPYLRTELWEVELETFAVKKLRDLRWFGDARYAPDGKRLLLTAAPGEFGTLGQDLPEGAIANSYDEQLFVWDPSTDEAQALTRGFGPSVHRAEWSAHDGMIYLLGIDGTFRRLYRCDPAARTFTPIDTGFDVVDEIFTARTSSRLAVVGSSAWSPEGLAIIDGRDGKARRIEHPADGAFADVRRGSVEAWSFVSAQGTKIDGHVYLPPDFDPARRWPAIVYYYGGVSPTDRSFGGRYPKEWWASNGYVVYVPQPSGAVGFGQAFAATHVNDWGKTSSEEIIEGTRRFLESHAYVDPERVGCIGASYGGFMTMLLVTKTDLYAAAVAHAGISSIASYWGEGYWGYSYSAVASANSFPWNRPDVYVERSPLFRADQVRVPILLTHGKSDTNVPVGESDAFFVALKLLGKEVEYVQVEDQDHWILEHDKRVVWSRTILAWFDRWLKDQPAWWDALYED